jgi:D-isomer specific 2-hydroxyacid dehydrogenase-like protein
VPYIKDYGEVYIIYHSGYAALGSMWANSALEPSAIMAAISFMNVLTIWANPFLTQSAKDYLIDATKPHRLLMGGNVEHVLDPGTGDRRLLEADIAFGQPDPATVLQSKKLRWIHLSSAGYAPYDTPEFRNGLKALSAVLTNSSGVYNEPCAQHLMAWLLADARQLYPSYDNQKEAQAWPQNDLREKTRLLADQTILIVGFGAIGRRLAELLAPYSVHVIGYRRSPQPASPIRVVGPEQLSAAMGEADHVINILPQSAETQSFFNAERLHQIKPGARYYAIGRGTTTDQDAPLGMPQFRSPFCSLPRCYHPGTATVRTSPMDDCELLHNSAYRRRTRGRNATNRRTLRP